MSKLDFTIRPILERDAEQVWEMRRARGAFEHMMALPSERLDKTQQFISALDSSQHELVAVMSDPNGSEQVVGLAGIAVQQSPRARHVASLGVVVHPQFHSMGVGTALLQELIDLADNWLMLIRLELTVYSENPDAKRLYERLGFEVEGIQKKASVLNGQYADLYMMSRIHPNYR